MDGKELISPSDLQSFYQHQHHQQQQHRAALAAGGGAHSPSSLAGMHSVIRPMPNMPNMNMSATAILNSIGGGSLAGMQFQMDTAPPPLMHNSTTMASVSASASGTVPPAPAPAEPVKRKRGRPRKYGPDGTIKAAASAAQQQQHQLVSAPPRMGSSMSGPDMLQGARGMDDPAHKKRRGRPPGTGKKQHTSPSVGKCALVSDLLVTTKYTLDDSVFFSKQI